MCCEFAPKWIASQEREMNLVKGWPGKYVRLRGEWCQVGVEVWGGDMWRKGNGVEAVDDWIVADMVEGVSEGTVGTASPCSVEKVDAAIDAFASKYRWICAGSEIVYRMCA